MRKRKKNRGQNCKTNYIHHTKNRKEKNKKVINAFFTSTFTKRLMVTQGNFSYQEKDTVQNKDRAG